MSAIIECKNLTHYYGQRKIYENLSFEVPQGRIVGVVRVKMVQGNDNH